ncbi:GNAT family N-acetyltransferase [Streptococcus moroccensis]|uniref:GNAT superfamily N-acetyltransferase n=1 Tax=Streptococcus moroccensis TaxID=1451356 RepID=A0ABT9YQL0_9STRE|nr:GNAT family N-acetyltransferase [Streptococcus moroccensis]MDQ0222280.1 GNAT superfamily N-acetyltransferase [Streptococcus moroccensis]
MIIKPFNFKDESKPVKDLYRAVGWSTYLQDPSLLAPAFDQSLLVLGAFVEDQLVGFIRCVGDGQHIVLIQDLLVDPDYQKQGIGRQLLQTVWETYAHVRMLQLNTDLYDTTANAFYQSIGMVPISEGQMISYYRKPTP